MMMMMMFVIHVASGVHCELCNCAIQIPLFT